MTFLLAAGVLLLFTVVLCTFSALILAGQIDERMEDDLTPPPETEQVIRYAVFLEQLSTTACQPPLYQAAAHTPAPTDTFVRNPS